MTWAAVAPAHGQTPPTSSTARPASAASAPAGPPPSAKAVQLVQRVDDVLFGVDPISLAIVDRRHVSGVSMRVAARTSGPPLGYQHFVADCAVPLRLGVLASATSPFDLTPQGASARARVAAALAAINTAAMQPVGTLDASRAIAEFACGTSERPAAAPQIAKQLFEKGGPKDTRTALCDLQPDGALQTKEDVEVRFSDGEKVVAVNNQWMSTGVVSEREITFGRGGARWRIDRDTAEASLITSAGKVIFAGSCIAGPATR
jgi:hypothetical protein